MLATRQRLRIVLQLFIKPCEKQIGVFAICNCLQHNVTRTLEFANAHLYIASLVLALRADFCKNTVTGRKFCIGCVGCAAASENGKRAFALAF